MFSPAPVPDRLRRALSLALSLALGGVLLWLALRGADLAAVVRALADGRWGWMVPFVLVGLASVAVRAWRWGVLIEALPEQRSPVPLRLTAASVSIGYLVNYAAPRVGELARSANVARRAEASFTGVLGTVVAERVLDVLGLALALASVALFYGDRTGPLVDAVAEGVAGLAGAVPLWAAVLAGSVLAAALAVAVRAVRRGGALGAVAGAFRDGLASVATSGRPGTLLVPTALLWATYGAMADLPFRLLGMDAAYGLGPAEAWAVMAVGGIGMAIPSPGGTGSFHYATVVALTLLFAVPETPAATYAILVHATGVVFYCGLGALALATQGTSLRAVTADVPPAP